MFNTYSANSLKILNNSKEEFKTKYIDKIELTMPKTEEENLGTKFHNLICYYLKNFDITKMESSLTKEEFAVFENVKKSRPIMFLKNTHIKYIEQSFFIMEKSPTSFYLTGRFDAIAKINDKYIIFDWKIKNIPKNTNDDIQTIVYMYALSKLYKTQNIEMIYYSILNAVEIKVEYKGNYLNKIQEIISKNI